MEPRDLARRAEEAPSPQGDGETFAGYGIMGLPFSSGHVLGLRRFPASSIGPGYTSVWHRDPGGRWAFYSDAEPLQSCNRYFGNEVDSFERTPIEIDWTGDSALSIRIPSAHLDWDAELASTFATRLMNGMGSLMPEPLWRSRPFLAAMSGVASALLGGGRIRLQGSVPNGQRFIANPRLIWTIPVSRARLGDDDFGPPGPLAEQAFLGDFAIPQRGIFAVGGTIFEPYDPARHLAVATRGAG